MNKDIHSGRLKVPKDTDDLGTLTDYSSINDNNNKKMIEIINKRDNTIQKVSENFEIEYAGQKTKIKDLQMDNTKIFRVIIQKDGEIDLLYKND